MFFDQGLTLKVKVEVAVITSNINTDYSKCDYILQIDTFHMLYAIISAILKYSLVIFT